MTREVSGHSRNGPLIIMFMNTVIKLMFITSTVIVNIIMIITFTRQSLDLSKQRDPSVS